MAMCSKKEKYKTARTFAVDKSTQSGNVLFLILIAVVLFSALAYAVTQSSQGTPGGDDGNAGQVNAAQITQFPNFVRAQVMRMMMNRIEVTDLEFNPPSEFGTLTADDVGVFHPSFGTTYVAASPSIMANDAQGQWNFNMNFEVDSIGTSQASSFVGNDLIGFLTGVKASVCLKINELLALDAIPTVNDISYFNEASENMDDTYTQPSGETIIGGANLTEFSTEPFGCFQETVSGSHIYYFAIFER